MGDRPLQLTVFLRPLNAKEPLAFGPLSLVFQILESSPELTSAITLAYEDGVTGRGKDLPCILQQEGSKDSTSDVVGIIKTLSSAFAATGVAGTDAEESDKISALLSVTPPLLDPTTGRDITVVSQIADRLDHQLTLRTFLVGYRLTAADFGIWGALRNSTPIVPLLRRGQHPHLARWYSFLESTDAVQKAITAIQDEAKNLSRGKKKAGGAAASFDEGLPNAVKGKVVTRFPPEPSGYLHIGHCKAAILNQHYAKTYEGKFLVRFDDTNPSKEKEEFQDAILEDLEMLGIRGDSMSYTSDYFEELYKYALQMIKAGKAYCDDTDQETMRAERMALKASARRDASVEDNLVRFAEMTKGSEEGMRWCLRAKISYDDPNGAMRDPVIYRTNPLPHHRTGDKWKVYPTYDFACPIVDAMEGVTHALRTNEYRDRNAQYWWMQAALGIRKVEIKDFARCNFVYTLLSKRKLKQFVETGTVRGWDDPRFATVRGIRRRGMTIKALQDFFIGQGDTQQTVNMEWDVLWSANKRVIDPVVPRHTALLKKDLVQAQVSGFDADGPYTKSLPAHKKNPEAGTKETTFGPVVLIDQEDAASFEDDEEITLMDWGNVFVREKVTEGGVVKALKLELHLQGDFKKTKKKVTWLAPSDKAPLQPVVLLDYDYLITKKKIEEGDNVDDFITPVSEFQEAGVADANVELLKKGDIIQFERKGFYIVDKAVDSDTTLSNGSGRDTVELIHIPDGRAASVTSKAASTAPAPEKKPNVKAPKPPKAPQTGNALPLLAPTEAQESVLQYGIPVKTKMFRSEPHYGSKPLDTPVDTKMFKVPSLLPERYDS